MKDTYLSIQCVIPANMEDELPALLAPLTILGTEIQTGPDGGVGVTVYLPGADSNGAAALRDILVDIGAQSVALKSIDADDWLAAYREQIQPFMVGSLWWIDPHPDHPTLAPPGRQRLVIEPRTAFGTGTHESTQAILTELEGIEVRGRRVLDIGTGSGILSLAAQWLGAEEVVGIDIDPAAIWVASETARQQEWPSRVAFVLGPLECLGGTKFDIVMCNMVSSSFLPLVDTLKERLAPNGLTVFAGLLASEIESVTSALIGAGFAIASRRILGEWASLTAIEGPPP